MGEFARRARNVPAVAVLLLALGAAAASAGVAAAGKSKPTLALVRAQAAGIGPGEVRVVDARCPSGYDVLGGSFFIGGKSAFAHASGAAPFTSSGVFRVIVANPLINPFAGIPGYDASVTVGAICAESGKPLVVDGTIGAPKGHKSGKAHSTVQARRAGLDGIENNSIDTTQAKCHSGESVFGGGYTVGGSLWAHTSSVAVLSKLDAFGVDVVHPPFNPTLGVLRQHASMRVVALCARRGVPIVLDERGSAARATATPKPKKKHKTKPRGTVVLVKETTGGIKAGDVATVDAVCPGGYSIFGGSEDIGGSTLAHATDAGVLSKKNAYEATVVNPPASPNAAIPKSSASLIVARSARSAGSRSWSTAPFRNADEAAISGHTQTIAGERRSWIVREFKGVPGILVERRELRAPARAL